MFSKVVKNFLTDISNCSLYSSLELRSVRNRSPIHFMIHNLPEENVQMSASPAGQPVGPYLQIHEHGNISSKRKRIAPVTWGGAPSYLETAFFGNVWASGRTWVSSILIVVDLFDYFSIKLIWNYHTIGVYITSDCYFVAVFFMWLKLSLVFCAPK